MYESFPVMWDCPGLFCFVSSISVLVWIVFAASCFPTRAAISFPCLSITKTDDALFSCPIPNVGWDLSAVGTALFKALQTRAGKKPCAVIDAHHTLSVGLMGSITYSSHTNSCSSRNCSQSLGYWNNHFWWSLVGRCKGSVLLPSLFWKPCSTLLCF